MPNDINPDWQERIDDAQLLANVKISGSKYPRVTYGNEYGRTSKAGRANIKPLCRDCGCAIGQLHVPYCCVEQCAKCGAQAISCDCVHTRPTTRAAR